MEYLGCPGYAQRVSTNTTVEFSGCGSTGFVAVIDAGFGVCGLNPATHPKKFGGPKTRMLKYLGLVWNVWDRPYTSLAGLSEKFHIPEI